MESQIQKSIKFSLGIAVITFVLAAIFSVVSESILNGVIWIVGSVIVLIIVFVGIVFDMFGTAATAADEVPFHAMGAEKVNGAKQALIIVRNADKFASFCNDVIGDISGIVSGTASTFVVFQIAHALNYSDGSNLQIAVSVIITSLVAALTVGGKAMGKYFAIHKSTSIILFAAKIIAFIEDKFHITILSKREKRN